MGSRKRARAGRLPLAPLAGAPSRRSPAFFLFLAAAFRWACVVFRILGMPFSSTLPFDCAWTTWSAAQQSAKAANTARTIFANLAQSMSCLFLAQ